MVIVKTNLIIFVQFYHTFHKENEGMGRDIFLKTFDPESAVG
jgi:hypothetical protein